MRNTDRIRFSCYISSFSTAATGNLSPLLFLVFRDRFGLSYSMLGLLIIVNFGTQLLFDLTFSFFRDRLPVKAAVKLTPVFMLVGLTAFGLTPFLFRDSIFAGMLISTAVFSCGSGLAEVLCSPVIAALPSDKPDRAMAALHSCYSWGVVFVVVFSTVFLRIFGSEYWYILYFIFSLLPLAAAIMFIGTDVPELSGEEQAADGKNLFGSRILWLSAACVFFGGAAECTMSQWCSAYLEQSVGLPKIWGDIGGVACFGLTMSLGRTLYAKKGRNTIRVLKISSASAIVCYALAALTPLPWVGLAACALTGLATAMLWPGTLVAARERIGDGGVGMYALLAAGGDLGITVCPEIFGMIADAAGASPFVASKALSLGITAETAAMRISLLSAAVIPLVALVLYLLLGRYPVRKE